MKVPFVSMVLQKVGAQAGVIVELEPEYGFAGELIFKNGKRHLFRNTNLNINSAGSVEIAKDKAYTSFFLKKHGFNIPVHITYFSDKLNNNINPNRRRNIDNAIKFAEEVGFPIYIKPNNLSQGEFVTKVHSPGEIQEISRSIFEKTGVALAEAPCVGQDYRIVVLGSSVISVYQRIPLSVRGDGKSSISALLQVAKENLPHVGRSNAEIDINDPRIDTCLSHQGLIREYVPESGTVVRLLDNANLSTGGNSIDLTNSIHESFIDICIKATKTLGLQLCGVDLITDDITQPANQQNWTILELNAAPGLDNYASIGEEQLARVEGLYLDILKYLEKI